MQRGLPSFLSALFPPTSCPPLRGWDMPRTAA
uniref:Uncharacterized protein n=1 Tax=Dulem virus 33 TaxID=3145751 RepID=A0AAU8B6M0_9CAUD